MSSSLNNPAPTAELVQPNPLLASEWASPLGLPPFGRVLPEHFAPAFEAAQRAHLEQVTAIASDPEPPTFENTALALDRAGDALSRLSALFSNLCSSSSSPALQEVEAALAGPLAAHDSRVTFTPGLFERLDALHAAALEAPAAPSGAGAQGEGEEAAPKSPRRSLSPVELRLVERLHLDFVRAGAKFDAEAKLK
jgi:peptidyl-dipeptidase Dcp